MSRPHVITRGDRLQIFVRVCTLVLSAVDIAFIIYISSHFKQTFSLTIGAVASALFADAIVILLFITRYRPVLLTAFKWLWFLELAVVVLLGIGFSYLVLADFGREAVSDTVTHEYTRKDAPDLQWRLKAAWMLLVLLIFHFFYEIMSCIDAFTQTRRDRFKN